MCVNSVFRSKALPSDCGEKLITLAITCDVQCVCVSGEGLWTYPLQFFHCYFKISCLEIGKLSFYQLIRNMTCKREDLSSVPSKDTQSQAWPLMFVISRLGGKERDMAQEERGKVPGNDWGLTTGVPVHRGTQAFPATPAHTQTRGHANTRKGKLLSPFPFGKVWFYFIWVGCCVLWFLT